MNKYLLAFLIGIAAINGKAQYNKLLGTTLSDWYVFQAYIPIGQGQKEMTSVAAPPVTWGKYTAKTDTILLSKNYKKFFHVYQFPYSMYNLHVGYLREDTINRKVYFMDKVTFAEDLLYDFSLNVGDSAYFNFPATTGNFPKGYYKVKSIQNVTIKAGVRKQFNLKINTGFSDTLKYTESVGSEIHPVYLYNSFYGGGQFLMGPGCKYPYFFGVSCKYSDNLKQFQSCTYTSATFNGCIFKYDSCNYWNTCSGINEMEIVKYLSVSPNPAFNQCSISIELGENILAAIELYDVSGRKIKTISNEKFPAGKNEIKFDVSELMNGLYFIKAKSENFNLNYPLLIQH